MKLVTIKEVSEFLKVKESTLYSWVRKGAIPSYKLKGLLCFDMAEIEEWVKSSKLCPCNVNIHTKKPQNLDIDSIVKKAIDDVTDTGYNSSHGKPGPSQGLRKEA